MHEGLIKLLRPNVEALGFEFWGLEFVSSGKNRSLLRVYIDQEAGISVDNCEAVSRQLSRVLDVEDLILREYTLEISSPGLERPLFYPEQYAHYCGSQVLVKVMAPIKGQRNFKAVLLRVGTESIVLQAAAEEIEISFGNIQKAHIIADWSHIKEQK